MDQPTNIKLTIKGKAEDVTLAVLAAQKRILRDTIGFDESKFALAADAGFADTMDSLMGMLGRGRYTEHEDGTAEYSSEQESYSCIYSEDIEDIAKAVKDAAPSVEAHLAAVITVTYAEGYDLCVDIDYANGEISSTCREEYYDDWEGDDDDDDDWLDEYDDEWEADGDED